MSPETLTLIAGAALSLLFSYIPGLNVKFAALSGDVKRLIMAGVLLVVSAAIFGLSCAGLGGSFNLAALACTKEGAIDLLKTFVMALVANQATYAITPLPEKVKAILQ